jgi:hypothetical protein
MVLHVCVCVCVCVCFFSINSFPSTMVGTNYRSFHFSNNFCIYELKSDRSNYRKQKIANLKELK